MIGFCCLSRGDTHSAALLLIALLCVLIYHQEVWSPDSVNCVSPCLRLQCHSFGQELFYLAFLIWSLLREHYIDRRSNIRICRVIIPLYTFESCVGVICSRVWIRVSVCISSEIWDQWLRVYCCSRYRSQLLTDELHYNNFQSRSYLLLFTTQIYIVRHGDVIVRR